MLFVTLQFWDLFPSLLSYEVIILFYKRDYSLSLLLNTVIFCGYLIGPFLNGEFWLLAATHWIVAYKVIACVISPAKPVSILIPGVK